MTVRHNKVVEVAGVDASVAVSTLIDEAGGDANAASDYLLEMRQKSEARRQSAQRVQTSMQHRGGCHHRQK